MSTATDYGTIGLTLVRYGTPSGAGTDTTQTNDGLPTSTNRRVNRNLEFQSEFAMAGTTSATGMLGTLQSQLGSIVLEGNQAVVNWFSYSDAQNDGPPVPVPLINVSATRIR